MFFWERYQLPDLPPAIDEPVAITADYREEAAKIVAGLSRALEGAPVVLAQHGQAIAGSGPLSQQAEAQFARIVDRLWRDGSSERAREVLRFEEEDLGEEGQSLTVMTYSAHVAGGLTLSVGWQADMPLTQVRAETADARQRLQILLDE